MTKDYFVGLHGAKINSGDFLIREKAVGLLHQIRPDRDLVLLPSWEPLDDKLELVNKSKGLIIMGGPAISEHTYPEGFPLAKDLEAIHAPIHLMGVGSYVFPASRALTYSLSPDTLRFLKKCASISTRDVLTKEILDRNGVAHVKVTGCPALFDLASLEKESLRPQKISKILLSTPQRKDFQDQLVQIALQLQKTFPAAKIVISFNRGFTKNPYTPARVARYLAKCNETLLSLGFETLDLSHNIEKMNAIDDFDLHVGYRLHSHILFLSKNKVSYLIAEDSRGVGNCDFLGLPLFQANLPSFWDNISPIQHEGLMKKVYYNLLPSVKINKDLPNIISNRIQLDLDQNYQSLIGIDQKIKNSFHVMKKFIDEFH